MRQVCAVTLLFLVYSAFVAGCDDSKAELDRTFVVSLKSKPRDQREGFVDKNKRKTITLTGSVKGVGSGGFGGSMVVFYLETRDAPREEMGGLDIAVTLDDHRFAECEYGMEEGAKATCKHLDGTTETIARGEKLTVTGIVSYCRGDWLNDRSLLMIGSAVINR